MGRCWVRGRRLVVVSSHSAMLPAGPRLLGTVPTRVHALHGHSPTWRFRSKCWWAVRWATVQGLGLFPCCVLRRLHIWSSRNHVPREQDRQHVVHHIDGLRGPCNDLG